MEQLVGIDAVALGHYQEALSGLQALAHHDQFLLDAPAAPPLLAEHFDGLVFAGSHKHSRLPSPYGKGERCPVFQGALSYGL